MKVVTNSDLEAENPDWDMAKVAVRTGVLERRVAGSHESALTLGVRAAEALLATEHLSSADLAGVAVCTQTADFRLPGNAPLVHSALGMRSTAMALDLNLACSGFPYGVMVTGGLLPAGRGDPWLLVTGDTYSKLIQERDRSTRSVFGDGGAATLVEPATGRSGRLTVHDVEAGTDGSGFDRFIVRGGGMRHPEDGSAHIAMDGVGMLAFVRSTIPTAVDSLLTRNGLTREDPAHFFFHQASKLALDQLAADLKVNPSRVVRSMETTGNLVSASIPACLHDAQETGILQPGDIAVIAGFGVGLSWALLLVEAS